MLLQHIEQKCLDKTWLVRESEPYRVLQYGLQHTILLLYSIFADGQEHLLNKSTCSVRFNVVHNALYMYLIRIHIVI
jgi:hypothetical protein